MMNFLTKTPGPGKAGKNPRPRGGARMGMELERALRRLALGARLLPRPDWPLDGRRQPPPPLPENIICFQRRDTEELNRPVKGRAMHHRHVMIIPLRGAARVCADDCEAPLGPGEGMIVLPYQYHHYRSPRRGRIHWLFVTFEYAQGVTLEPLRNVTFRVDAGLAAQLSLLLRDHKDNTGGGLPELRLALLLAKLAPPPSHPSSGGGGEGRGRVGMAAGGGSGGGGGGLVSRVNHGLQTQAQVKRVLAPTVRELAGEVGMSPSHLRARFRASCGVSLGRHMRKLRLERAAGLLRMSAARISEVAEQCGFASVYSFSRAFRRAYGAPPTVFRKGGQGQ
ncbi:MAG: helix-turn-helix transcriptional regulator [Opitutaceae bacterium]|nr:helix-turn-helix transcriptional regulator [Opitutaceae bacterium]